MFGRTCSHGQMVISRSISVARTVWMNTLLNCCVVFIMSETKCHMTSSPMMTTFSHLLVRWFSTTFIINCYHVVLLLRDAMHAHVRLSVCVATDLTAGFMCNKINAATVLQALAGLLHHTLILFYCT